MNRSRQHPCAIHFIYCCGAFFLNHLNIKHMKSKEITKAFVATAPDIMDEDARTKAISEMIKVFINDLHSLLKARNIETDQGLLPIFRELEQKWNAVRRQLCKHYGVNVIIQNGFREILKQEMPMAYEFYVGSNEV